MTTAGTGGAPVAGASGGPAQPMGPCPGGAAPSDEACDGKDNDCDGKTDEGLTRACGPAAQGACKPGTETCTSGAWGACEGAVEAKTEVCDPESLDEDCDGSHNEGCSCVEGTMQSCGKNTGLCMAGVQMCESGNWSTTCNGAVDPKLPETCDPAMVDENCDGQKNEGCDCSNGQSEDCESTALGPCKPGKRTCNNGKWSVCAGTVKPSAELCDSVDNNCDGQVDNSVTNCKANERCESGACKCTPQCTGKTCGPDGCGGTCAPNSCNSAQTCANGQCVNNCGNRVIDSGEMCDDGVNSETGACPHCSTAFCGDSYIQAGVEECEQNASGWGSQFCSPSCTRTIYKKCDAAQTGACASEGQNTNCAAWVSSDASTYVCAPYCDTMTACPRPGGFEAFCSFAFCALLCRDGICPNNMRCARNVPLMDGLMGATVMRDVCLGS
jgi:hypothetical protein